MGPLVPRIAACAETQGAGHGSLYVAFVVRADGSIESATVEGIPDPTGFFGTCVSDVAKTARLPPFERPTFLFRYPFRY